MAATEAYRDRLEAGERLAGEVARALGTPDSGRLAVLGLPRGGVPVGAVVAQRLRAPLDVCLVRKVGTPGQAELALGAVAEGGVRWVNGPIAAQLGLGAAAVESAFGAAERELLRLGAALAEQRPRLGLAGWTAVLVDDGLATGASMLAGVEAVRRRGAARVAVAVPVAAAEAVAALRREVDVVVCPHQPNPLVAVGCAYADFAQTSDAEVVAALRAAAARIATA